MDISTLLECLILHWSTSSPPNSYCSYDHCYSDTPFGRYQIEWKSWKDYPGYVAQAPDGSVIPCHDNLDDAKNAVRAHIANGIAKMLGAAE